MTPVVTPVELVVMPVEPVVTPVELVETNCARNTHA